MLFIITSSLYQSTISQWISNEEDLQQEVRFLVEDTPFSSSALYIKVADDNIIFPIDWYNAMPPLFFPSLSLQENSLLGILYGYMGEVEKALAYFKHEPYLSSITEVMYALQQGLPINRQWIADHLLSNKGYFNYHNTAIAFHYGTDMPMEALSYYEQAIALATDMEHKVFTIKHYALLLVDIGEIEKAKMLIEKALQENLPTDAMIELKAVLLSIWTKQHSIEDMGKIPTIIQEVYHHYQSTGQHMRLALLLIDASYLADSSNQFSEALQSLEKAMQLLKEAGQEDLYINTCIRKGTLLLAWAKSGQPQFYRPALQAFQEVLQLIDREALPHIFAEVHHHLGVIYAEIPDEIKKKSLWAGVSVSSFNEALQYFSKETYPYEYALICNNFGNAYTKYPVAVLSNNFDKALEWYTEALTIRTPKQYPAERARTLLNYLEASWYATNDNDEIIKLQKLKDIAQEIRLLTQEKEILEAVNEHFVRLQEAEHIFNNTKP